MKVYWASSANREMQIITLWKSSPQSNWQLSKPPRTSTAVKDVGKGEPYILLLGVETGTVTMESCVKVPQRHNSNIIQQYPSIPNQNGTSVPFLYICVESCVIHTSQVIKPYWMPINREINKENVHTHDRILSSYKE